MFRLIVGDFGFCDAYIAGETTHICIIMPHREIIVLSRH